MTIESLEKQRQEFLTLNKKKKYFGLSIIFVVVVALTLLTIFVHKGIGFLLFFAFYSLIFLLTSLAKKTVQYTEQANSDIFKAVLEKYFFTYEYKNPEIIKMDNKGLSESGLLLGISELYGKNYINGEFKSVKFMTCEVFEDEFYYESFGRWYEFELGKSINNKVIICDKSIINDIDTTNLVECETISHSDKYVIYASEKENVLNSKTINFLIEMEEQYEGKLTISFVNNALYVLIKGNEKEFIYNFKKPINEENLAMIINDVQLADDIIDGVNSSM